MSQEAEVQSLADLCIVSVKMERASGAARLFEVWAGGGQSRSQRIHWNVRGAGVHRRRCRHRRQEYSQNQRLSVSTYELKRRFAD